MNAFGVQRIIFKLTHHLNQTISETPGGLANRPHPGTIQTPDCTESPDCLTGG